jgi:hypothetical protein
MAYPGDQAGIIDLLPLSRARSSGARVIITRMADPATKGPSPKWSDSRSSSVKIRSVLK